LGHVLSSFSAVSHTAEAVVAPLMGRFGLPLCGPVGQAGCVVLRPPAAACTGAGAPLRTVAVPNPLPTMHGTGPPRPSRVRRPGAHPAPGVHPRSRAPAWPPRRTAADLLRRWGFRRARHRTG